MLITLQLNDVEQLKHLDNQPTLFCGEFLIIPKQRSRLSTSRAGTSGQDQDQDFSTSVGLHILQNINTVESSNF